MTPQQALASEQMLKVIGMLVMILISVGLINNMRRR